MTSQLSKTNKFYIVDFEDGPEVVRGTWLSKDMEFCSWPPWAVKDISRRKYDKMVHENEDQPNQDWKKFSVLRIRAYGDNFEKVRRKLKIAEDATDTDLNSFGWESDDTHARFRKSRRKRQSKLPELILDDEENADEPTSQLDSIQTPVAPKSLLGESRAEAAKDAHAAQASQDAQQAAQSQTVPDPAISPDITEIAEVAEPEESADSSPKTPEVLNSTTSVPGTSGSENAAGHSLKHKEIATPKANALALAETMSELDFKAYVILNLSYLRSAQTSLCRDLAALSVNRAKTAASICDFDSRPDLKDENDPLFGLPAVSIHESSQLESKLNGSDQRFIAQLASRLNGFGGSDIVEYLRQLLERLLTNPVAAKFSFTGHEETKQHLEI